MVSSRTCLPSGSTPTFEPAASTACFVTSTGASGGAAFTVSSAVIIFVRIALPQHLAGADVEEQSGAGRRQKRRVQRIQLGRGDAGQRKRRLAQRKAALGELGRGPLVVLWGGWGWGGRV